MNFLLLFITHPKKQTFSFGKQPQRVEVGVDRRSNTELLEVKDAAFILPHMNLGKKQTHVTKVPEHCALTTKRNS